MDSTDPTQKPVDDIATLVGAIRSNDASLVRQLLARKPELGKRFRYGRTLLHIAAEEGRAEIVALLLDAGLALDSVTHDGDTALHSVSCYGRWRNSCFLFEDAMERDPWHSRYKRPVHPRIAEKCIVLLEQHGSELAEGIRDSEHFLESNHSLSAGTISTMLQIETGLKGELLASFADLLHLDPDFDEYLQGCPRYLDTAKVLLEHGSAIDARNKEGETALEVAVKWYEPAMVKLLLERGATSNCQRSSNQGKSLLDFALDLPDSEIADLLLKHSSDFDSTTPGLLHSAADTWRSWPLLWLLDHGADINQRDDDGNTPLIKRGGYHEPVEILLNRGADVSARNKRGESALHTSAGWPECLKLLLPLGLPVNEQNIDGNTPLHLTGGAEIAIQMLLQAGASPNIQNHDGNTPLHLMFFSEEFRPDVEFPSFHALVSGGCDRSIANKEGKTAYDLGVQWNYPKEYLDLLRPGPEAKDASSFIYLGVAPYSDFLPSAMISVELDGTVWPSCEHYFHARKVDAPDVREKVRQTKTTGDATVTIQESKILPPKYWSQLCDGIMRKALLAKFQQHPALRQALLNTGSTTLVSDSSCEWYWIERSGVEFSTIGKMIMSIREELKNA